jgi:hypothetical protein
MDTAHGDRPSGVRRLVMGLSAIGALVTGVMGWLGSVATLKAHPPMEAAVFIAAAAVAFGLLAVASFRR